MDGNFSAEHMKMKANMDFNLTQSSGHFTAVPSYKEHLQIANDQQLKSTCHEHKAVNQVHVTQKHLVVTGISTIAYARHGFFVPDTIVDFQKVVLYDIACQFSVNFYAWVLRNKYLKFHNALQILWGIGLYSPDLIPSIGKVDGEVLKTLWGRGSMHFHCHQTLGQHNAETSVWQVKHSQQKKSHAWDTIHQVNAMLKLHTVVYRHCCKSMVALGASLAMLEKYQVLKPEYLEYRTIKINPSMQESALVLETSCQYETGRLDVRASLTKLGAQSEISLCQGKSGVMQRGS
ncbi:hypothetical protein BS17DRAFT_767396 [Gyrodon lividus]|nr:hypothetical protein BS17DRAFT_767396 [Gyrodon lividus]